MNSDIGYSGQYLDNKEFRIKVRTGSDIHNATGDAIVGELFLETPKQDESADPALYVCTSKNGDIYKIADLTEKVE